MNHNEEGFDKWLSDLRDEELEEHYRQASADWGNALDAEQREYFGDRRHAFTEELEHRDYLKVHNRRVLKNRK